MRIRSVVLTGALALGLAAPAGAETPPDLTGHVRLSGATSGWLPVAIPRTVDVRDVTASVTRGRGLRGFDLRSEFVDNAYGIPYELRGLAPIDGDGRLDITATGNLPPGRYRLYLFTSEGQIDVDLGLGGLTGDSALSPATPIPVDAGPLLARPQTSDGHVVVGRAVRAESYGFVWYRDGYRFGDGQTGDHEICVYRPTDDPFRDDAYTPGCPGAERDSVLPDVQADRPSAGNYGEGYEVGGWMAGRAGVVWGLGVNGRSLMGAPPELYGYIAAVSLMPEPETIPQTVPIPGGQDPAPPRQPGAAPMAVAAKVATTTARRALVTLRCPGPVTCRGTVSLAGGGARRFAVPAHATRVVALPFRRRVSSAILRIVTRDGALRQTVIRLRARSDRS